MSSILSHLIIFALPRPLCVGVHPSLRCPLTFRVTGYLRGKLKDLNETWHEYSTCEWAMLRKYLKVRSRSWLDGMLQWRGHAHRPCTFDADLLTTREVQCYIISVVSVCMYVCQTITFESIDVQSSFSLIRNISRESGSSLYAKIIGSRSRSWEQKRRKSLFP